MKKVLITGAGSGLGFHLTKLLAENNFTILATSRNLTALKELQVQYNNITPLKVDITVDADLTKLAKHLKENNISIDILINNAGYAEVGPIETTSINEIRRQYETNVFGALSVAKLVLPSMRKNNCGKIINIGSSAGRISTPINAIYASTKHALLALSEGLRYELQPFNIDVCLLEFGKLETPYNGKVKAKINSLLKEETVYKPYLQKFLAQVESKGQNLAAINRRFLKIISEKRLKPRYTFDFYTKILFFIRSFFPDCIYEKLIMHKYNK